MRPQVLATALLGALLGALPRSARLEGAVVTEYGWSNANCSGPISQILAAYKLDECVASVYTSDGYLRFGWATSDGGFPGALQLARYGDDQTCTELRSTSSENLFSCNSRPDALPPKPKSKMTVFGPARITMSTWSNPNCAGSPTQTLRYLSYACHNTPQGSESVGQDRHRWFSDQECAGEENSATVTIGQCMKISPTTSREYVLAPPSYEPTTALDAAAVPRGAPYPSAAATAGATPAASSSAELHAQPETSRQVMGNTVSNGGVNTSTSNASYIAFRIPGAVFVPKSNALLVYAEARKYSQNDWGGQHDMTLRRSTDGGRTFGPLMTIVDTAKLWPERCPVPSRNCSAVWDPSAVYDSTSGVVHLFFGRAQDIWQTSTHRDSLWRMASSDGGLSWSQPVDESAACHRCAKIDHPYPHRSIACTTPGGGHGIQMRSGRLVLALYSESIDMGTTVCLSDDGGASWRIGKQPVDPAVGSYGALEPELVELFHPSPPQPQQPAAGSKCQASLTAFCNTNPAIVKFCSGGNTSYLPFVALYDTGSGGSSDAWRCYSHLSLDASQRHWDARSTNPHAYCTNPGPPSSPNAGGALQALRAQCAPPPPPPNAPSTLMATLRRIYGAPTGPGTTWCGNGVQNCRAMALSTSGGDTWHNYTTVAQLPDPGVKAGIFRFEPPVGSSSHRILSELYAANASVAAGALLFVNANPLLGAVSKSDWEQRVRTTLRLSLDNGASWPFSVEVDARSGYATIASLSDPDCVALVFEDTVATSNLFPSACSGYPSPKGVCDGGVLINRVNISELLLRGAWSAPAQDA